MTQSTESAAAISIGRLRAAYARGVAPRERIAQAYERIEQHRDNPIWIALAPREEVLARADALVRRADGERGPLFGVPFAVKDNIDVAGMPTTAACAQFTYTPSRSAPVVERLLDAGAICIGKTNLDQFATGLVGVRSPYGACRNAFDARFISGGSSSGSAVAVALGLVSFALGTDTAGSGRVPAAFNNVVGLKPTRGYLSTRGVVPACRSLDCVSVFALDCADAAEVARIAAAFDAEDPFARAPASFAAADVRRFGVPRAGQREFFGDREYARLYEQAIARLCSLGLEPIEIDYAPFMEVQRLLYEGPWLAERLAAVGEFAKRAPDALHPVIRQLLERAAPLTAVDAFRGMYRLAELRRAIDPLWEEIALMLLPAVPTIYRIEEVEADPIVLNAHLGIYTNFVNLLDLAAINVPAGLRADGIPFGVSLVGPAHADEMLAHCGGRLHAALGMPSGVMPDAYPAAAPSAPGGTRHVRVAVMGAHLSGLPLNEQLTRRCGRLVRTACTAPLYRMYALEDAAMARPGLVRVGAEAGGSIDVEVWELATERFGGFVAEVAPPLAIGTVELADGERLKGFLCEHYAVQGRTDITGFGGWRNWLAHRRNTRRATEP